MLLSPWIGKFSWIESKKAKSEEASTSEEEENHSFGVTAPGELTVSDISPLLSSSHNAWLCHFTTLGEGAPHCYSSRMRLLAPLPLSSENPCSLPAPLPCNSLFKASFLSIRSLFAICCLMPLMPGFAQPVRSLGTRRLVDRIRWWKRGEILLHSEICCVFLAIHLLQAVAY